MNRAKLTLALAPAILVAALPVTTIYQDPRWLPWTLAQIVLLTLIGGVIRRLGVPDLAANLVQLVALFGWLAFLALNWAKNSGTGTMDEVRILILDGLVHFRTSGIPVLPNPGALWLTLAALGLLHIIIDLLALGLEQPAWTLAPLLTPALIPTLSSLAQVPWWHSAAVIAVYGLILLTERSSSGSASVGLIHDDAVGRPRPAIYRAGAMMLIPVTIIGGLIARYVPAGSLDWVRGLGQQTNLELTDPSINLADNLNQPTDSQVMTYRSSTGEGAYFRLASLPVLTSDGARLADLEIRSDQVPPPPGATQAKETTFEVSVGSFSSEYLPAPYSPVGWSASGEWGWDSTTTSLISLGKDSTRKSATKDLTYTVTSRIPNPNRDQVAAATAGRPLESITSAVPEGIPSQIVKLTREVTSGAQTAGQKAIAIESFLRSDEFSYTTSAPAGRGYDLVENFLLHSREGFCVHFATSMALMARIEGIPSRVAIGFLPGSQLADGTWRVTSHNMHAWPELYFAELGWVAFEPTGGAARSAIPPAPTEPTRSPEPTSVPQATQKSEPTAQPSTSQKEPGVLPQAPGDSTQPGASSWGALPWLAALTAIAAAVAAAPAIIRRLLRRRRLSLDLPADQRALQAWAEVRADWEDLREQWPSGSPRQIAKELAPSAGSAVSELFQLSGEVELALFAATSTEPGDLSGKVAAIRAGFRKDRPRHTILAANLLPRSLKPHRPV